MSWNHQAATQRLCRTGDGWRHLPLVTSKCAVVERVGGANMHAWASVHINILEKQPSVYEERESAASRRNNTYFANGVYPGNQATNTNTRRFKASVVAVFPVTRIETPAATLSQSASLLGRSLEAVGAGWHRSFNIAIDVGNAASVLQLLLEFFTQDPG